VSSSGTALAQVGIKNAFANAANLAALSTGTALATTPAGNGTVPQAEINTLANILAACVNSNGTGPACTTLFANAESGGSTGTQPTDTATAAINMAHNPGANVAALYGLSTGNPPFAGGLSAQPNDFTVALNFTGGGINSPMAVAIDSAGNAWVSNRFSGASVNSGAGSVTEISSVGSFLSGPNGYTAVASGSTYGGVYYPFDLAVDRSGNAWIANFEGSGVTEISSSGATISPPYGYPPSGNPTGALGGSTGVAVDGLGDIWVVGFDDNVAKLSGSGSAISPVGASGLNGYTGGGLVFPFGVAIDGSGDAWIANTTSGTGGVTEFSRTGSVLSGATGYTGGGLDGPRGIAIDSSGNAWVTNYNGTNAVTEISNAGTILFAAGLGNDVVSPEGVAIDGSGSVWVTSYARSLIAELSNTGATLSSALPGYAWGVGYLLPGATQGVAYGSVGVAVDGSGDVWIAGSAINTVAEFIGAATPVITPIAAGLPATPTANGTSNLGTRP
jgi:hypothetical protein